MEKGIGRSEFFFSSPDFKKLDKEAKEVQQKLIQVPELQWIKPFCKEDNRRGSFISHLFQWIECKLPAPVSRAVSAKFQLAQRDSHFGQVEPKDIYHEPIANNITIQDGSRRLLPCKKDYIVTTGNRKKDEHTVRACYEGNGRNTTSIFTGLTTCHLGSDTLVARGHMFVSCFCERPPAIFLIRSFSFVRSPCVSDCVRFGVR